MYIVLFMLNTRYAGLVLYNSGKHNSDVVFLKLYCAKIHKNTQLRKFKKDIIDIFGLDGHKISDNVCVCV